MLDGRIYCTDVEWRSYPDGENWAGESETVELDRITCTMCVAQMIQRNPDGPGLIEVFPGAMARREEIGAQAALRRNPYLTLDQLLARVHEATGGLGVDIQTFGGDGSIEIRWRRDYGDCWSDERFTNAPTMTEALWQVIEYEREADRADAEEEAAEERSGVVAEGIENAWLEDGAAE